MKSNIRGWCALVMAVSLTGCAHHAELPVTTGARDKVQDFYEALLQADSGRAYAVLDPASRAKCGAQQFDRLAAAYRQALQFSPEKVQVRSCEEVGDTAVAHVVFSGPVADGQKFYKDAITLHWSETGWGIILPPEFGRASSNSAGNRRR
jgi:hypothetical protein